MASFCLDGSALPKRFVPETRSALVDFPLYNVPEHRIYVLYRNGGSRVGPGSPKAAGRTHERPRIAWQRSVTTRTSNLAW